MENQETAPQGDNPPNSAQQEAAPNPENIAATIVAEKRGRGRPKGSAKKSNEVSNDADVTKPIDTAVCRECIKGLVGGVDEFVKSFVYSKAFRITKKDDLSKELQNSTGLHDLEKAGIANSATIIVQSNPWLNENAASVFLIGHLSAWGIRVGAVMMKLNQMEAQLIKLEAASNVPKSSSN